MIGLEAVEARPEDNLYDQFRYVAGRNLPVRVSPASLNPPGLPPGRNGNKPFIIDSTSGRYLRGTGSRVVEPVLLSRRQTRRLLSLRRGRPRYGIGGDIHKDGIIDSKSESSAMFPETRIWRACFRFSCLIKMTTPGWGKRLLVV
jgi:hypothetical protein